MLHLTPQSIDVDLLEQTAYAPWILVVTVGVAGLMTIVFAVSGAENPDVSLGTLARRKRARWLYATAACGLVAVITAGLVYGMLLRTQREASSEADRALTILEISLHDRYEFVKLSPILEQEESRLRWVRKAVQDDPIAAPEAEVQLPDGTIVTWRITLDPETGEAQFFNATGVSAHSPDPHDALQQPTRP